ncbi:conserved exported hypothetical protein [Frankia canadensis]|uniref:DUF4232 domain-containing protein n=1 Tax=Frankia canadensis TaxID=1836972 RepID=A0A2I2KXN2_9ACTN|nr:DUF4232 domain-containing protein [Frankia canadensis]SNQ50420.1 conserved exported hypothetical protein [Frankia canadensis]SOU57710.1 conserved exported hypothetical protein [Frankia canadensis]
MRRLPLRSAVAGAAAGPLAVLLGVSLAACGGSTAATVSGSGPAGPGPSTTAPGATGATATGVTAAVGGGSAAPAGRAAARCAAGELTVTLGAAHVNTGDQHERPVILTNRSSRSCAVTGYPGVELVARDGSTYDVVRSPLVRPSRIVLAPGGQTRANLRYLTVSPGADGAFDAVRVLVTPPDTTTSTPLTWDAGPVLDQSGATHPGTWIMAFAAYPK